MRSSSAALLVASSFLIMVPVSAEPPMRPAAPAAARSVRPASNDIVPIVLLRRSTRKAPDGTSSDVLVAPHHGDDLAARAGRVMRNPAGYGQFVLRLDRFVKTYLLHDADLPTTQRAALGGPAFLFLSDRQGGFPAEGFWLEQPDGSLREMKDAPFVDMIVRERDLAAGDIAGLEAIYAHELGHLMMAALAGPGPRKASSGVHFITVRTDAWSAFIEGFGEHFQPMAANHARTAGASTTPSHAADDAAGTNRFWYQRFAAEQANGCWICPANLRFLSWQGPGEQRLRDGALRTDLFIHRVVLPTALLEDQRPPRDVRMYRDVIPPSRPAPLKNGAEALSSEGVVATLFYRIASDERIRHAYREAAFYEPFVADDRRPELATSGPQAVVPPSENVYLKIFHVLHRHFSWGDWPTIEFVRGYATAFPDEAEAVYDVFLDVTRGVTVDRAAPSRQGDLAYLTTLRHRLMDGSARLDGALGPALWMVSPGISFGMGVFRYFLVPSSLTFDLNAADVADLRSVPGVSTSLARAIVATRDARGPFGGVTDLGKVPGMTPELVSQFAAMHDRMRARLTARAQRRADPGWLKDYLVAALKGSYYVAASWQFARAALLAGLAYLMLIRIAGRMTAKPPAPEPGAARRRWWRRTARLVVRSIIIGALPCLLSVGVYACGWMPTAVNMAGMALVLAGAVALAQRLRGAVVPLATSLSRVAACVAAAAVVGWMY